MQDKLSPVIETVKKLEEKLSHITKPINLSIIGCVVNGPGEAAQTEIGLTGGDQIIIYCIYQEYLTLKLQMQKS